MTPTIIPKPIEQLQVERLKAKCCANPDVQVRLDFIPGFFGGESRCYEIMCMNCKNVLEPVNETYLAPVS